jgi:hypothetical protein
MKKYHVTLSFAGEDRAYVEKVATRLADKNISVFYDKFEQVDLWGKDLYAHLSQVYKDQAHFTVMFISEAYKRKLWTNHERKSAQARAFAENQEYILPAYFDINVEVPGVLKTTGHIDLADTAAVELAEMIIEKLRRANLLNLVASDFTYADYATADVDYPIRSNDEVSAIITSLKSCNWYKQSPAIEKILRLDWSKRNPDEAFVLGRNIYQCAEGGEHIALTIMKELRRELAKFSDEWPTHILNGMFYEAYFNHNGEFRGPALKANCIPYLFSIETVTKFEKSISYIQRLLEPHRNSVGVIPNKRL